MLVNNSVSYCGRRLRTHFRGVQGSNGEVEAQAHSQDQFADQECSPSGRKEFTKDTRASDQDTNGQGESSAVTVGKDTAQEAAEELANGRNRVEGTEPGSRDHIATFERFTKVTSEGGNREHCSVDLSIKTPTQSRCVSPEIEEERNRAS
jgi:hypothetical protein